MLAYPARFLRRGRHAMAGLGHLWRTQPADLAVYTLSVAAQFALGLWLGIPAVGLALLWLSTSLVLLTETINTAVERTVDRVGTERHPLSGLAKDLAAGAVFLAIAIAIGCALLVLGPPLVGRFG